MEAFPWWSEEHKQLAKDVRAFMEKIAGREMESRWKRDFPFDLYEEFGKTGFTGASIPKEYGGMGLGCTGGCIVAEEVHRVSPGMGRIIVGNMMGGLMQFLDFGTEEQKKKWLPRIAQGEIGCVAITEMTAGTDASAWKWKQGGKATITFSTAKSALLLEPVWRSVILCMQGQAITLKILKNTVTSLLLLLKRVRPASTRKESMKFSVLKTSKMVPLISIM